MAYDYALAERIRAALANRRGWTERKMFWRLAFLRHGKMCCRIIGERLMVRVGGAAYERALRSPHAQPMDFSGKPMRGFVSLKPPGIWSAAALRKGIALGAAAPPPAKTSGGRKRS